MTRSSTNFAEVRGGRLYYESNGSGDAIVLIHGSAGDRRHWDGQFSALTNDYWVIRYDVRGFGQSSLPVEDKPYSDYEDLAILLDHLSIKTDCYQANHQYKYFLHTFLLFSFSLWLN